jgi:hypothetical protein
LKYGGGTKKNRRVSPYGDATKELQRITEVMVKEWLMG